MIRVSRSHDGFVVFQEGDFSNHHAHVKSEKIANTIRKNISKGIIPDTSDIRIIESYIRVATDTQYRISLLHKIEEIETLKELKRGNLKQLVNLKNDTNLNTAAINYSYGVIENSYYQPKQIVYRDYNDTVNLYYSYNDTNLRIIIYHKNDIEVELHQTANTPLEIYHFAINQMEACHLVKRIITNKFKAGEFKQWDE